MKDLFIKTSVFIVIGVIAFSCSGLENEPEVKKLNTDSVLKANEDQLKLATLEFKPGVVDIIDIPEMLTISKIDSAPMRDVSFKVAKAYSVLEAEMNEIGASLDGMPGMITYNNDTTNFKFECVLPIKELPKKQPRTCKIVVLEACPMLIYNYFGPYQQLFTAYNKIREYNKANGLEQNGPMREFYLTDPTVETNPAKWQTRIMVPVVKVK
ncbi:MAG: GyrI-like domain-containing protein [Bacteroidetes bacterium]|nr:GyrI-like domain-containing protein [Bacteroidota bacterium]